MAAVHRKLTLPFVEPAQRPCAVLLSITGIAPVLLGVMHISSLIGMQLYDLAGGETLSPMLMICIGEG